VRSQAQRPDASRRSAQRNLPNDYRRNDRESTDCRGSRGYRAGHPPRQSVPAEPQEQRFEDVHDGDGNEERREHRGVDSGHENEQAHDHDSSGRLHTWRSGPAPNVLPVCTRHVDPFHP